MLKLTELVALYCDTRKTCEAETRADAAVEPRPAPPKDAAQGRDERAIARLPTEMWGCILILLFTISMRVGASSERESRF